MKKRKKDRADAVQKIMDTPPSFTDPKAAGPVCPPTNTRPPSRTPTTSKPPETPAPLPGADSPYQGEMSRRDKRGRDAVSTAD